MAQASRIMEILQEMIHIDSETNTPKERQIEQYLQKFLPTWMLSADSFTYRTIAVNDPSSTDWFWEKAVVPLFL